MDDDWDNETPTTNSNTASVSLVVWLMLYDVSIIVMLFDRVLVVLLMVERASAGVEVLLPSRNPKMTGRTQTNLAVSMRLFVVVDDANQNVDDLNHD